MGLEAGVGRCWAAVRRDAEYASRRISGPESVQRDLSQ